MIIGEQRGNAHVTLGGEDFNQRSAPFKEPGLLKTSKTPELPAAAFILKSDFSSLYSTIIGSQDNVINGIHI